MFRYASSLALPVSLAFLLSACGHDEPVAAVVRPAMVVKPEPSALAMDSYPGEVRARFEPDLAFRIGGKVSRRLVEEGQRSRPINPWLNSILKMYTCNWKRAGPRSPPPRPT